MRISCFLLLVILMGCQTNFDPAHTTLVNNGLTSRRSEVLTMPSISVPLFPNRGPLIGPFIAASLCEEGESVIFTPQGEGEEVRYGIDRLFGPMTLENLKLYGGAIWLFPFPYFDGKEAHIIVFDRGAD